ncbi:MAG: RagB/SusD family nutrient uptake outer membrane protein [Bacteroidales bacterium]|nr:RagB/SusD family nutrient uptake outer membrane protein [Bacteroidales bacterium]
MKKILIILSAAVIAVCASSCEKFLESEAPSTFDAATIFSNYSLAESQMFSALQSIGETNSYRGRYLSWIGLNSDIEWYNTFKPTDEKYQIAGYTLLPNNGQLNLENGPFAKLYEGIERLNLTIEGITRYGKIEENADMASLLGEAMTLRAMFYYDLVRAWGDVPARFEPTTSETIYVPKASRDTIFVHILKDLESAIPTLAYPGKTAVTSRTDRINKVFAEGLYARIALMASGYAIRPDDNMVGTGDPGTNRITTEPQLQKSVLYPKALEYLRDAINSKSASLQDYETLWKNQSNRDNLVAGPGYETLYVIPFSDGRGRWNYTFAIRTEGSSYAGGPTVTRGGDAGPIPTMWFRYDPKDIRRDLTCVNWRWNADDEKELPGIQRWYFGKYRFEWITKDPYTGGNDDGVKPLVMRYADILLMAAEIANEQGELSEAKEYLRQIRHRAFPTDLDAADAYVDKIGSKDAMFNAIVDERALEFCGEMTRKFDLIRWNLIKDKMDESRAEMRDLRELKGKFANINGLNGDVYYKASGSEITVWGLTGEVTKPKGDWVKKAGYINKILDEKGADTGLYDDLIDGIYSADPVQHMFWPIFNTTMINSQGKIKNDYGYDNL